MKALRAVGKGLMVLWMLNGALHVFVMPFTQPERFGFHIGAGLVQCVIAWIIFDRLSAAGKPKEP